MVAPRRKPPRQLISGRGRRHTRAAGREKGTTKAKPGTRRDGALRRALDLLEKVPLVDGHNDLPWVIRRDPIARGDVLKYDLARRHNDGDTDAALAQPGNVGVAIS